MVDGAAELQAACGDGELAAMALGAREVEEEDGLDEFVKGLGEGPAFDVLRVPRERLADVAVQLLYNVVAREGLAEMVSRKDLRCFVTCTASEYGNTPFHNFFHAVSVMQVVQSLVSKCELFSSEERLLLCLTALCHDAGHLGYTNSFLAKKFKDGLCAPGIPSTGSSRVAAPASAEPAVAGRGSPQGTGEAAAAKTPGSSSGELDSAGHEAPASQSPTPSSHEPPQEAISRARNSNGISSNKDGRHSPISKLAADACLITDPGDLVSKYGTLSPMEKHHVMLTLKLLRKHESILRCLLRGDLDNQHQSKRVTRMVLHVILCTDLALHKALVAEMGAIGVDEAEFRKKLKAAALLMHAADLSNAARPFDANYDWSVLLNEEKRQVEGEGSACSCVDDLPRGEVFFCANFVLPTWEASLAVFGEGPIRPWINSVKANIVGWERLGARGASAASGDSAETTTTTDRRRTVSSLTSGSCDAHDALALGASAAPAGEEDSPRECASSTRSRRLMLNYTDSFIVRSPAQQICDTVLGSEATL